MRLILLLCSACLLAASEPVVPTPQALPEGVFAVVIVPDVRATVGRIELALQSLKPDALPPGMLTGLIGTMVGDPGLAHLAAGATLIAIGPGGAVPNCAVIVPATDPATYAAAAASMQLQAEAVGSLVVIGQKPADLALGKRVAANHATLGAGPIRRDLRLLIAPQRIITAYQPVLGGFVAMMTAQMAKQPNGAVAAKLVGLELAAIMTAGEDVAACQLDIGLDGTVLAIDDVVQARAGSDLAKALVPSASTSVPKLAARMGLDPGYVVAIGSYNAPGMSGWLTGVLERLRQTPAGKDVISADLIALMREAGEVFDGGFALRLRAVGDDLMRMEGANGARDAGRFLALQKRLFATMFASGPIADLYRAMGMSAIFSENTRKLGPVSVAKVVYTLDEDKLPKQQAEQMRKMMKDVEFAFLADAAVFATVPADLDRLVAGGGKPLPTTAEHTVGPGRDGYVDFDWLTLIKISMKNSPQQMQAMGDALAKVPSGEPMTAAWTAREGRLLWEGRIPLKPFFDFAEAMAAGAKQMRGGQNPPPEAPPENTQQMF